MHVHTETVITAVEVMARLDAAAETDAARAEPTRKLRCESERVPPKILLTGLPLTLPAAAEVSARERSGGTDVVLRLMWGPLPAPFPRAMAAAGIVVALIILVASDRSLLAWLLAALVALLPLAALLYQRSGERALQARVDDVLGGAGFSPQSH